MKKYLFILLLLVFSCKILFAQKISNSCITIKANNEWKELFEKTNSTKLKFNLIQEKIVSDSKHSIGVINYSWCGTRPQPHRKRNLEDCDFKIQFLLYYSKKKSIRLDLKQHPEYHFLINHLNETDIEILYLLRRGASTAIFGQLGQAGTLGMKIKNRKLKRVIRKMNKPNS